jgi:hypothetical protein
VSLVISLRGCQDQGCDASHVYGSIGEKSPAALFADIGIDRQQKAWFLLATQAERASGAFSANQAIIEVASE